MAESTRAKASRWARTLVLAALTALLGLGAGRALLPTPSFDDILLAATACLPLFAPLPGLLQGRRYTYAWASLCVIPCFVVGLMEAIANPGMRLWAALCLGWALILFTALIAYLRLTRPFRQ